MTTWTRLATVALTAAGLIGLGTEAAAQCATVHSGVPTMIVLANSPTTQTGPATSTTTTTQGTTSTTAAGIILADGRVVPDARATTVPNYYMPGGTLTPVTYWVDGTLLPASYGAVAGSTSYMHAPYYSGGHGMYGGYSTYVGSDCCPEKKRRGLFRRR